MGVYFYFNYSITKNKDKLFVFLGCNIETSKTVPKGATGNKTALNLCSFVTGYQMPELIIEFVCLLLMQLIILIYGAGVLAIISYSQ